MENSKKDNERKNDNERSKVITYTSNPAISGHAIGEKPKESETKIRPEAKTYEAIHPKIPKKLRYEIQNLLDTKYNGNYQAAYDEIQDLIGKTHPNLTHKVILERQKRKRKSSKRMKAEESQCSTTCLTQD